MVFSPFAWTTVVVRSAMHGSLARPGRQSHTVPDVSGWPVTVVEAAVVAGGAAVELQEAMSDAANRITNDEAKNRFWARIIGTDSCLSTRHIGIYPSALVRA